MTPGSVPVIHWVPTGGGVDRRKQRLGIALIVVGFAVAAVAVYFSLVQVLLSPVHRFDAPGGVTERLDGGEERAVFVQTAGSRHGRVNSGTFTGADLGCTVRDSSSGAATRLRAAGDYSLTHDENAYAAKLEFRAPRTGRYRIECTPTTARQAPLPLAVGPRIHFWRSAAFFIGGLFAFGALTLVGGVMISRARSRPARPAQPAREAG